MPETWLAMLLLAGFFVLRLGRSGLAQALIGALTLSTLAIGILPVDQWALEPLENQYPANPPLNDVRGIIVLGGGLSGDTSAQWSQPALNEAADRYTTAMMLARRFPGAKLYLVGGTSRLDGKGPSEATIGRSLFISLGITASRLRLEAGSRTTAENAQNLLAETRSQRAGTWVLVTSAFHMRRAIESFCAVGWRGLTPYPTDYRTSDAAAGLGWAPSAHLAGLTIALKERAGLFGYRLTGRAHRCK